jgi:two-component system, OmpR family, response regulator MprA
LIVDDDRNIISLLVSRLKSKGYEAIVALDGVVAVSQAHKERPDLILLDMRMPGGGGISVYDNLRLSSETIAIPVIFMTAYPEDQRFNELIESNKNYLVKPFDMEVAIAKVKEALGDKNE